MKRMATSKKGIVIATVFVVVLLAAIGLFWYAHTRTPIPTQYGAYVPKCSAYTGTYDFWGAESIKAVADENSKAIVIATADDPKALSGSIHLDDPASHITITQVLKGRNELHKGDNIPICSGLGYFILPEGKHPTILVFLDGKDGDTWVPTFGISGIVPEGKHGRFDLSTITSNPKTASVSELQKILK